MPINNFEKYFSIYEPTNPPPIITEGYLEVLDYYLGYLNHDNMLHNTPQDENPKKEEESYDVSYLDTKSQPIIDRPRSLSPAEKVINLARSFIGTKYLWGGTSPSTGFDCSGLILYVFKLNGIDLPRTSKEMETVGSEINDIKDVKLGDIICTSGTGETGRHVLIVSKIQDGQIYTIEARGKKDGIIESPLRSTENILTIRRVLGLRSQNYIINYFLNKGLTLNLAKGIYGNIMLESGGNIKALSKDGHNSYGLALWTGDRKLKLFTMYGSNPTAELQLDFLWWELNNTHKSSLDALKLTTTVEDAVKVFMDKFERPHKDYANFNRRLRFANSIY